MKLSDLSDGMTVRVRVGRAGRTNVIWEDWYDEELFVQRVSTSNKRPKGSRIPPGGIATLALKKRRDWAEYTEDEFDPNYKVFLCEDYYLEIDGLEP